MTVATITTKGQITIPAAVRKALGVASGDRIAFVRTPAGQYEILPAKESVRTLKGFAAKTGHKLSIEEMNRVIAQRRFCIAATCIVGPWGVRAFQVRHCPRIGGLRCVLVARAAGSRSG